MCTYIYIYVCMPRTPAGRSEKVKVVKVIYIYIYVFQNCLSTDIVCTVSLSGLWELAATASSCVAPCLGFAVDSGKPFNEK